MATWSSIRDKALTFYQRWKPEIQIYGIGLLLTVSGLITGRDKAAALVFCLMCLYDLIRRFGEPYRALGEQEFARRAKERQEWWREQTEGVLARFIAPAAAPEEEPPPVTRLIPALPVAEEDLPESPAAALPEIDTPTIQSAPPVVTHET